MRRAEGTTPAFRPSLIVPDTRFFHGDDFHRVQRRAAWRPSRHHRRRERPP